MKKVFRTKAERKRAIKNEENRNRVKLMRKVTGDHFSAKNGFDLRSPASWTPAQKAKVTKAFKVLAPMVSDTGQEKVYKRYRKPARLREAISQSGQEQILPFQTAAIFRAQPGQDINVTVDRKTDRVSVEIAGASHNTMRFNKARFLEDPEKEIRRVLDQTDARIFTALTGANETMVFSGKDAAARGVMTLLNAYAGRKFKNPEEWLNGFVAYKGKRATTLEREQRQRKQQSKGRKQKRDFERRKRYRAMSPSELKSIRKTGRRGRVK